LGKDMELRAETGGEEKKSKQKERRIRRGGIYGEGIAQMSTGGRRGGAG